MPPRPLSVPEPETVTLPAQLPPAAVPTTKVPALTVAAPVEVLAPVKVVIAVPLWSTRVVPLMGLARTRSVAPVLLKLRLSGLRKPRASIRAGELPYYSTNRINANWVVSSPVPVRPKRRELVVVEKLPIESRAEFQLRPELSSKTSWAEPVKSIAEWAPRASVPSSWSNPWKATVPPASVRFAAAKNLITMSLGESPEGIFIIFLKAKWYKVQRDGVRTVHSIAHPQRAIVLFKTL